MRQFSSEAYWNWGGARADFAQAFGWIVRPKVVLVRF